VNTLVAATAVATLLGALQATGEAPPPIAAPALEATPERPPGEPPPGDPADRALWTRLKDGTALAAMHMARVAQCAYRIRYARYYESLDERLGDPAASEAARAWRGRLEEAARRADAALPAEGGRVRACRYVLLDLETWMEGAADPRAAERLPAARREAGACVERMERVVAAVAPAADALEAALLDVDRFLGRAPPAPPGGEEPARARP
jgi:hypothetical protein